MGGMMQLGSSSAWRNSGRESSGRDDEEALTWAALEKLPTYSRVRKGILNGDHDAHEVVDVDKLGFQEKRDLLQRLVRIAEDDNENFLLRLRRRIDRVGIEIPTVEVRFEQLNVIAQVRVGGKALPSVWNFTVNIVEGLLTFLRILPTKKRPLSILQNVSGILKPGRITLLLGPPGSGKTTLLLALAGKLATDLKVSGNITYNGHQMDEFVPQRASAYISQNDLHVGEMTVRETLAFSARAQGVGTNYDMLVELSRREKEANIKPNVDIDIYMKAAAMKGQEASVVTDYILKILGLDVCADTLVGDEMIRGISGGQRKRLTTGEMLVGPAKALFMDEISTGLDSSTTYQIVNSIRQSIHILKGTALISLLQPAPETYDLFDDIILLSEGKIVYQGPRMNATDFFQHMGFKCPERKGVADFLQEVTSRKDQEQYWNKRDEAYRFVTVDEFVEAFQVFHVGRKIDDELAVAYDKAKSHPAALTADEYGLSKMELFKACLAREALLMKRNKFVYIFTSFQLTMMALIVGTLFLKTNIHKDNISDGLLTMGSLYFSLIQILFNGYAELSMTIMKLPVFYKQRDLRFFPAWAYAIPTWILKLPISIIESAIWVIITYFMIGYDPNVNRFFRQYAILLCIHQVAYALFRFNAALGRNMVIASTFGTGALVILLVLGGFIISREDLNKWWIWGYYISPIAYAQNALSVNEFLGHTWNFSFNNSQVPLGVQILRSRGIFPDSRWFWIGIGALIGFSLFFNFLFSIALTVLDPIGRPQAIVSEETLDEKEDNGTSDEIGLSSRGENNNTFAKRGMVLPFQSLSFTFEEIRYSVDMPAEMKDEGVNEERLEILKSVSGAFRPGVLTALMGVSGAGKTTLMDVLAGRKTGGRIDGEIKISGYPKKQETFARISGYCEQADIHSPHVTVYESLLFSAWLRLSPDVDNGTREMFMEEVMDLVELKPLREALVGLAGVNGLSTEQRKRLTIAVELVANPSIIFMDEPTSGLDARAAAIVMRTVRNTVNTGRTVVCTIHQPSIDIFDAFDELLLLKRGGEQIYFGPVGRHGVQLINYFEGINGVNTIKEGYNPATWMMEVTSVAQESALNLDFTDIYKNSEIYRQTKELIKELSVPEQGSKDLYFSTIYSQSFFTQCMACLWKQYRSYWRNTLYNAVRIIFSAFIGLVFGSIFWDMGSKRSSQQDLFNAMGSMYIAVLFLGVTNAFGVQPVVSIERTVFYRERAAGMYSALPYTLGQIIIELPYCFIQDVVYGIIVYAMMNFQWEATKFIWFLFFMYFSLLYFTYYGMMTIGITPNHHIAAVISAAFYGLWNLFSGFIIPRPRMPVWWRWYYWANPISWSLYGLVVSQFGDMKTTLDGGTTTVEEFLRNYFGFKHDFLGVAAIMIVVWAVLFSSIFVFSIKAFNFQRR